MQFINQPMAAWCFTVFFSFINFEAINNTFKYIWKSVFLTIKGWLLSSPTRRWLKIIILLSWEAELSIRATYGISYLNDKGTCKLIYALLKPITSRAVKYNYIVRFCCCRKMKQILVFISCMFLHGISLVIRLDGPCVSQRKLNASTYSYYKNIPKACYSNSVKRFLDILEARDIAFLWHSF